MIVSARGLQWDTLRHRMRRRVLCRAMSVPALNLGEATVADNVMEAVPPRELHKFRALAQLTPDAALPGLPAPPCWQRWPRNGEQ